VITLNVTLRRKLLGEIPFYQLAGISECDSTDPLSRNVSSTFKATMKPVLYFIHTDGQIFGLSAVIVFQNFGDKWSYLAFPTTYWYFAEQVLHTRNK